MEVLGLPVLPSTFGEHKVLVILLRFLDTPATTASPPVAAVQSLMFGTTGTTVSNFYRENSYQQTWLTGTVVGPLLLPMTGASCDYSLIATLAQQALTTLAASSSGSSAMSSTRSPPAAASGGDSGALGACPGRYGSTAASIRWSRRTSWVTTSGSITPTPSSAGRWPWAGRAAASTTATSST